MNAYYKGQRIGGCAGPALEEYDTEEQVVGRWIDGKPLYRKVFSATLPQKNGDHQKLVNPNIVFDNLVSLNGIVKLTQETITIFPIPFHNNIHNLSLDYNSLDGIRISINTSYTPLFSAPIYIISEYTKTTD